MRGRLIALAVLAGTIAPAGTALATQLQPGTGGGRIGVQLIDVPPVANAELLGHAYIVGRLVPGARITRQIEITNSTLATANVSVYAAGATQHRSIFAFAPGHGSNELSSWTSVSRHVVRMQSRTKTLDTVTINVPKDASSGERYALVWAEVSATAPVAGGVTLVNRVGIRMYVSVGPGGAPPSKFVIRSIAATRSTGGRVIVANIRNSGRRTLELSGTLTLSNGPGRLSAGPFPVKFGRALSPNDTRPLTVRLDKRLPRGPWRVQLHLTSGPVTHTAVATLTFPAG
jgi:hypothetical protein